MEACYLLDPGVLYWKTYSGPKLDRSTSMLTEAEEEDARRRKAKEIEEERTKNKKRYSMLLCLPLRRFLETFP